MTSSACIPAKLHSNRRRTTIARSGNGVFSGGGLLVKGAGSMGLSRVRFVATVGVALMLIAACGGTSGGGTPAKTFKIGLVTDTGGLHDKSFNHLAALGLEQAKTNLHVQGDVVESHSGDDYVPNLTHFATLNYDLVIGVGFLMATA